MIVGGIASVAWGLPAMHRLRKPFDILVSLLVLCGTVVVLLGCLLAAVPGFFN
jgi:hypothetical protein